MSSFSSAWDVAPLTKVASAGVVRKSWAVTRAGRRAALGLDPAGQALPGRCRHAGELVADRVEDEMSDPIDSHGRHVIGIHLDDPPSRPVR